MSKLSIVSLGMAGFALLQSTQGDGPSRSDEVIENTSAEAAQEIRELAANLRGDAEELRLRYPLGRLCEEHVP